MGVIQLPTYQPQAVETHNVREQRPDLQAKAAMGQAQGAFIGNALDAATQIGGQIIAGQRSNQMTDLVNKYSLQRDKMLRDLESKPIDSLDPRFQGIPDAEKALPNLFAFTKDRQQMLNNLLADVADPKVRDAFTSWANERWVSEQDGVAKWDAGLAKAAAFANFAEDFGAVVDRGDPVSARTIADAALSAGTINGIQYDSYMDAAHKDISKRGDILKAVAMGPDAGQQWLANADNLKYATYDGSTKDMPLADREDLMKQFAVVLGQQQEARKAADSALNRSFEDGFNANIDSISGLVTLRDKLNGVSWYDDGQKKGWTTTLTSRIEQLTRDQAVAAGGGGMTPDQKTVISGNMSLAMSDWRLGKLSTDEIRQLNRMALLGGMDSSTYNSFDKEIGSQAKSDPSYSDAFNIISGGSQKSVTGGKPMYDQPTAAQLAHKLQLYIDTNTDNPKDWIQYATNLRDQAAGDVVKSRIRSVLTGEGLKVVGIEAPSGAVESWIRRFIDVAKPGGAPSLQKAIQDQRLMGIWQSDPDLSAQVYAMRELSLRAIAAFTKTGEDKIRVTLDESGQAMFGVPTGRGAEVRTYRLQSDGAGVWLESWQNGFWQRIAETGTKERARPASQGGGFLPGLYAAELAKLFP